MRKYHFCSGNESRFKREIISLESGKHRTVYLGTFVTNPHINGRIQKAKNKRKSPENQPES